MLGSNQSLPATQSVRSPEKRADFFPHSCMCGRFGSTESIQVIDEDAAENCSAFHPRSLFGDVSHQVIGSSASGGSADHDGHRQSEPDGASWQRSSPGEERSRIRARCRMRRCCIGCCCCCRGVRSRRRRYNNCSAISRSKSSGRYQGWLTPEQFGAQFGPSDVDIQAVTQWLASQGFGNVVVGDGTNDD